jgi:EmrB/QacA subfamily drug resistance transporter
MSHAHVAAAADRRTDRGRDRRERGTSPVVIAVIACAATVLANLDLFVVNVGLPDIGRGLHDTNLSALSWVINGYLIVYAALLIPAGKLADRYGDKYGFLAGAGIFTVASVACAVSVNLPMLLAFRLVQAAGAALLTPTSLSLILAAFPAERRERAVRAWAASGAAAAALGPVVGGLLLEATWRAVFYVNLPVAVAALAFGAWLLPAAPGVRAALPDAAGTVLVIAGVGALTFGLVQGGTWGWGSAGITGALAASAVALGLFVAHTLRSTNPVIDPALFRVREFTVASIVLMVFYAAFGGMVLSFVLWEENAWGWSGLKAGLGLFPGPIMVPVCSMFLAGPLIRRFGFPLVSAVGSALTGGGLIWWAIAVTSRPDYAAGLLGGLLVVGVGCGLAIPTLIAAATSSLPPRSAVTGSAAVYMFRQVTIAVGVAVFVAVLGTPRSASSERAAFDHGWIVLAAFAFAGAAVALLLRQRARPGGPVSPVIKETESRR